MVSLRATYARRSRRRVRPTLREPADVWKHIFGVPCSLVFLYFGRRLVAFDINTSSDPPSVLDRLTLASDNAYAREYLLINQNQQTTVAISRTVTHRHVLSAL